MLIEAMGSYRRGEAASGDLDILITRDPSDGKDHRRELDCTPCMSTVCMLRHIGLDILRKLIERLVGKNVITFTVSFKALQRSIPNDAHPIVVIVVGPFELRGPRSEMDGTGATGRDRWEARRPNETYR